MAVNLAKYKESLISAWKDVLDDKCSTDWALFGYEGQSNDLKVVSKGAGGIEEMTEDLNSGKIMYAFCKVMDPKTSLPKYVLINWQGEGAPLVRKGTCANHLRDVANFFKGAHVTINARNEEEVDPQLIVDKVAKSTGSAYSFKERSEHGNEAEPVGTTYKRVIPRQEINSKERDKFWEKEEMEEKQRQEEERKRKEEERKKLEDERKRRELEEAAIREERIKERTKSISQIREAERNAEERLRESLKEEIDDREEQEAEHRARSDVLRRQRSQEAQAVISQRTFDARAVFEQNTSAGQLHQLRRASLSQANSYQGATVACNQQPASPPPSIQPARKASLPSWPPHTDAIQTIIPEPPAEFQNNPEPIEIPINNVQPQMEAFQEETYNEVTEPILENHTDIEQQVEWTVEESYSNGDLGLQARALYDYQAADSTEITFDPGDIITHIDQIDEGWWQGLGPDGTFGLFPANYVELLNYLP